MKAVPFAFALAASTILGCSATPVPQSAVGVTRTTAADVMNQTQLQDRLREAFLDRATWSHLWVVASSSNAPDRNVARERLYRAQAEIGELFSRFYGGRVGERVTKLLERGMLDQADAIRAAASRDHAGVERARRAMNADATRVAAFLATVDPALSETGLGAAMRTEVDAVVAEIQARASGDFAHAEDRADAVEGQNLALADILAGGLVEQFPNEVGPRSLDARAQSVHVVMRDAFHARAALLHEYVLEGSSVFPATDAVRARLLRNASAIARPFGFFYGEKAGAELGQLLRDETKDATATIDAVYAGDAGGFDRSQQQWGADIERVAAFVARVDPFLDRDTFARALDTSRAVAIDDAHARNEENWTRSVQAADELRHRSERAADMLSGAIISRFQL